MPYPIEYQALWRVLADSGIQATQQVSHGKEHTPWRTP
jgi:hypothetical protein